MVVMILSALLHALKRCIDSRGALRRRRTIPATAMLILIDFTCCGVDLTFDRREMMLRRSLVDAAFDFRADTSLSAAFSSTLCS